MRELETVVLRDEIARCEDVEDLKEKILPMLKNQQQQWSKKINEIIAENGYTKSGFADICKTSRVTVDKWCKGAIPKNRETFLRIGMAANYDIDKINQFLQRYGQYPALYSKSLEDCICMFVINNCSDDKLGKYQYILDKIKANIIRDDISLTSNVATVELDEKLSMVQDETELERFVTENIAIFSSAYHRFYAYVKTCIDENYPISASSVFNLAEGQGWSSSLRQCVSAIRQNKWYPTRNKIISLGLHLSMDHEQIDDMLRLAHMEPLCAKNIFESVIMFILDDASLNNMLDEESEDFDPDELCRYARSVLNKLELPEVKDFITELPEMDDEW